MARVPVGLANLNGDEAGKALLLAGAAERRELASDGDYGRRDGIGDYVSRVGDGCFHGLKIVIVAACNASSMRLWEIGCRIARRHVAAASDVRSIRHWATALRAPPEGGVSGQAILRCWRRDGVSHGPFCNRAIIPGQLSVKAGRVILLLIVVGAMPHGIAQNI
jgi:hypothetical protein